MAGIQVGPIQNGQQSVTIGNFQRAQTVVSTPEKVDEFVTTHDNIGRKANKKCLLTTLTTSLVGLVGGVVVKATGLIKGAGAMPGLFVGALSGIALGMIPLIKGSVQQQKLAENFINEKNKI